MLGLDKRFWKNRRVLVTGQTGFKGGWLCKRLHLLGTRVCGYALPSQTEPNFFDAVSLGSDITSVTGNVTDRRNLENVFTDFEPEIVFHLAAQALVRRSYREPVETYRTNVLGTVMVLECARHTPSVQALVNVTSDKCYENSEIMWGYRESDPMGGHDPYSSSKGCSELVTTAYRKSFTRKTDGTITMGIASARAGNVFGGGDWAEDRLIPDFMRSVSDGGELYIRNPGAVRPWQHVLEPVSGYMLLAQQLYHAPETFEGGWNFGPSDLEARTVGWIAERLVSLWGEGASFRKDPGPHPHEAYMLKLDCTKAHTLLSWRPRLPLETGLEWTVSWHKEFLAGADMRSLTEKQINDFDTVEAC